MYQKILLAMHGEEINMEKVMEQTIKLANEGSKITLLKIIETNLIHYGEVDPLLTATARHRFIDYINELGQEETKKVYNKFNELSKQKKMEYEWIIRRGKPADEIIKALKDGDYDLLVLGTKEPGPGNTSSRVKERVAKEHLCTVLMVK